MRNTKIMRIMCLLLATLILVSSIVIVVHADGNDYGGASIEDFKDQMSTISYDDYMKMYSDYFGTNKTGKEILTFDATKDLVFKDTAGNVIEIKDGSWTMTAKDGTVYSSLAAAVSAGYNQADLVYPAEYGEGSDKQWALYTPDYGSVTWTLDLAALGMTEGGLYFIGLEYYSLAGKPTAVERSFKLNGSVPFAEARSLTIPKIWASFMPDGETAISATYELGKNDSLAELEAAAKDAGLIYTVAEDGKSVTVQQPEVVTEKVNAFLNRYELRFFLTDNERNEIRPTMEQVEQWASYTLRDSDGYYADALGFVIEPTAEGTVDLALDGVNEAVVISKIVLTPYAAMKSYEEYKADVEAMIGGYKEGSDKVKLEAEYTSNTSTNVVYPIEDRSSALSSPVDTTRTVLNTIGTEKWATSGQWAEYKFSVETSGFYNIYSRFKQSYLDGMYVSRSLQIFTNKSKADYKATFNNTAGYYNGAPFAEAAILRYDYSDNWQVSGLTSSGNADNYKIYFEAGVVYTLRFEVTLGSMNEQVRNIESILTALNNDYLSILKLTGTTPDDYRDYNFYSLLPEVLNNMSEQATALKALSNFLKTSAGVASTYTGVCDKLYVLIEEMVTDEDTIAKNLDTFKSYVGSLGTFLTDAKTQPLQLDYLCIQNSEAEVPKAAANFWQTLVHEVKSFIQSFLRDYNSMGAMGDVDVSESVEVWVPYGRDQANVLRNLSTNNFTPNYDIAVNLKLVNAGTLLPSILAGMGPDIYMGLGDDNVINYAIRGALEQIETLAYDSVEAFEEAMYKSYNAAAMVVLGLEDADGDMHYYGLPETQSFSMMFVRKDILAELGIEIPKTWEDIYVAQSKLESNNMEIGVTTDYKIFLYQMGGELFADEGMRINLDSVVGLAAFEKMCNMFTQYSFPYQYDAANRFRTGEMPIIISNYTALYNQLKVFATELDGLWTFVPMPGFKQADGSIKNESISGATATVMISGTQNKQSAWKFMEWQTGSQCQIDYANEMVAIMGDSAKHSTANRDALKSMTWTREEYEQVSKQFENLAAIPNYPGSYIIGRYTNFAFLAAYNEDADPTTEMLSYINIINTEITRKREEFKLETLQIGQKLSQKRLNQATEAVKLLEERYGSKYADVIKAAKYAIVNAERRIEQVYDTATAFAELLPEQHGYKEYHKVSGGTVTVPDYYVNISRQTSEEKYGGFAIDSLNENELIYFISEALQDAADALASY
ncbi:MAG: extracellular solute-binding protein [Clostridia bacterium]|nr:extracellular solute-binding protein [Clostridia bacterium]